MASANKKAQLSSGKTRYSLYSFCCSSEYHWPSRSSKVDDFHLIWKGVYDFLLVINSNLGDISHNLQDIASFFVENAQFSYPFPLNPKFKNVSLARHSPNFARKELRYRANYSCKKFPLKPRVHILWMTERLQLCHRHLPIQYSCSASKINDTLITFKHKGYDVRPGICTWLWLRQWQPRT